MKPASIKTFDLLFLGSVAIGAVAQLAGFAALADYSEAEAAKAGVAGTGFAIAIGAVAVWLAFNLVLWFLVSKKRIRSASLVIAALAGYGLLSAARTLGGGVALGPLAELAGPLLALVSVLFLFRADAAAWFKGSAGG